MVSINDVKELVLAAHLKQKKYKYNFIIEIEKAQKRPTLFTKFMIVKYHKEKDNGKIIRVVDRNVYGSLLSLLTFMADELNEANSS